MRKWLRPDWRARLLDLFACFLIPLYTLLFTHDTRWFTTNFSVIAAARDQRHGSTTADSSSRKPPNRQSRGHSGLGSAAITGSRTHSR